MPTFKKGQTVAWTSQASGFKKKKTGVIKEVIAAGRPIYARKSRGSRTRDHRSYIVNVNGKLYWPLVKYLKLKA